MFALKFVLQVAPSGSKYQVSVDTTVSVIGTVYWYFRQRHLNVTHIEPSVSVANTSSGESSDVEIYILRWLLSCSGQSLSRIHFHLHLPTQPVADFVSYMPYVCAPKTINWSLPLDIAGNRTLNAWKRQNVLENPHFIIISKAPIVLTPHSPASMMQIE